MAKEKQIDLGWSVEELERFRAQAMQFLKIPSIHPDSPLTDLFEAVDDQIAEATAKGRMRVRQGILSRLFGRASSELIVYDESRNLGLTPSAISKASWTVRYPEKDRDTKYSLRQDRYADAVATIDNGQPIVVPGPYVHEWQSWNYMFSADTSIKLKKRGLIPPMVVVETPSSSEYWFLRDNPTGEIDNQVIALEKVNAEPPIAIYASITLNSLGADGYR